MKQVEWVSPECVIPGHGVAAPGNPIYLPDDLADKFISQGDAKVPIVKSKLEKKGGDV